MLRWRYFSEFSQKTLAFLLIIVIFLRERVKECVLTQKDGVLVLISSVYAVVGFCACLYFSAFLLNKRVAFYSWCF